MSKLLDQAKTHEVGLPDERHIQLNVNFRCKMIFQVSMFQILDGIYTKNLLYI